MSNIISKKIKEARAKPVGIVATKVNKANFFDKLETFGTVIANRTYSIRIKKSELIRRCSPQHPLLFFCLNVVVCN